MDDKDWDDNFPDGVFAVPPDPDSPKVKLRKLVDWCRENEIPLSEIQHRPELVEQFLVYPNDDGEQEKKRD